MSMECHVRRNRRSSAWIRPFVSVYVCAVTMRRAVDECESHVAERSLRRSQTASRESERYVASMHGEA